MKKRLSAFALAGATAVLLSLGAAPAQAAELGGFSGSHNLSAYCEQYLSTTTGAYAALVYPNQGAYGWRCWDLSGSVWIANSINMSAACSWAYGAGAWASTPNGADPYSWRCYR